MKLDHTQAADDLLHSLRHSLRDTQRSLAHARTSPETMPERPAYYAERAELLQVAIDAVTDAAEG